MRGTPCPPNHTAPPLGDVYGRPRAPRDGHTRHPGLTTPGTRKPGPHFVVGSENWDVWGP
jgi:hypothetical protein